MPPNGPSPLTPYPITTGDLWGSGPPGAAPRLSVCLFLFSPTSLETRARFFKRFNPDKIDPDLVILFFAIHDHVIHLTFEPVFQSNIGLDQSDPDRNCSGSPNLDNQSSNRIGNQQCRTIDM